MNGTNNTNEKIGLLKQNIKNVVVFYKQRIKNVEDEKEQVTSLNLKLNNDLKKYQKSVKRKELIRKNEKRDLEDIVYELNLKQVILIRHCFVLLLNHSSHSRCVSW